MLTISHALFLFLFSPLLPAPCCWTDGIDKSRASCADDNPICEGYAACKNLHQNEKQEQQQQAAQAGNPPAAPPTLDQECSANNLETLLGLRHCGEECAAAACCWIVDDIYSSIPSCEISHKDICTQYNKCKQLADPKSTLNSKIIPAPATISQDCSTQSVSTSKGLAECEAACMKAPCCWAKENTFHYSCHSKDSTICTDYDVCFQLHGLHSLKVPPAPSTVAHDCSPQSLQTYHGYSKCNDSCMQAPCCWAGAESPVGSCLETHPTICKGYSGCTALNDPNSILNSKTIEAAPTSIVQDCSASNMETADGLEKCERTCMDAPCCWTINDGAHYSCRNKNLAACETYDPCVLLSHHEHSADLHNGNDGGSMESSTSSTTSSAGSISPSSENGTVEVAPSYISTACAEMINGDEVHGYMCELACRKAECCWNPAQASCGSDPNCGGYTICGSIEFGPAMAHSVAANHNIDKDWIDNACKRNSLECVRVCTGSECCFDNNGGQAVVSSTCSADCNKHAACSILHKKDDNAADANTSAPGSSNSNGNNPAPTDGGQAKPDPKYNVEMVTDACLNHDNTIVNLCAKVCKGSECCFTSSAGTPSCGLECGIYAACSTLHKDGDNPITKACSTDDLSDCVAACGDASCCFTNSIEKSCDKTNPSIICAEYTACEKLFPTRV